MIFILSQDLQFHIESWLERDSNPRPRAYRADALTTEVCALTIRCG